MSAQPPPVANESEGLLGFLAAQRRALRAVAAGLSPEQLRATPTASSLSVGGLMKHTIGAEEYWIAQVVLGVPLPGGPAEYAAQFVLRQDEDFESLCAEQDRVAELTESMMAQLADLDYPVAVPDYPWFPKDVSAWSLRWVLLHLIEELARHCGHADIIRESIDGATQMSLGAG
ncbi:MAG: DinB family protein [Angustibacter sp.]